MDTHPHRPDDVSDLERRLAACEPSAAGLDADAMLFAAGQASARPGARRYLWPALAAAFAALAGLLAVGLTVERGERLALARQLQPRPADSFPTPPPPADGAPEPPTAGDAAPDSVLAAHRALQQGLDAWPPRATLDGESGTGSRTEPVLRVGLPASVDLDF
jgi:hypothetical protein